MKFLAYLLLLIPATSFAATIERVSPLNLSNTANQIRVNFSDKMINLSSPQQNADLFNLNCVPQVAGRARWNDDKTWVFDFQTELNGNFLPGGTRCQLQLKPTVKTLSGVELSGSKSFIFQIDGPNILQIRPSRWGDEVPEINEDQVFVLQLDSAVQPATVLKGAYFVVSGKSSAVPVRLIEGIQREEILRSLYGRNVPKTPTLLLQARETFPANSKVSLVWGEGIVANGGMARKTKANYEFVARQELRAEFTCTRENAKANCSPLTAMEIQFSAPIASSFAEQVRLMTEDGKAILPVKNKSQQVYTRLVFEGPFAENKTYRIEIPKAVVDDSGRPLANSRMFPLTVKTAELPPLAKFAAEFGVIEASEKPNLMPATLRNLEAKVLGQYAGASVGGASVKLNAKNFSDVIKWMQTISERNDYEDREKSLLAKQKDKVKFNIPLQKEGRSFEVVGIPLPGPGFYIVELESKVLGRSLIGKERSMYVPSAALVTNLAVHLKWGIESSLFWVTSLDQGQPVAGAAVRVHDCSGRQIWQGKSDRDGVVHYKGDLRKSLRLDGCTSRGRYGVYRSGFFVTAQQGQDFTFTHSSWTNGIETYRFGVNGESPAWSNLSDFAHTVFARTLLRAGETVHMKHILRRPSTQGLAAANDLPNQVSIEHLGSGTKYSLPLKWDKNGYVSESTLDLPKDAKLGIYQVSLVKKKNDKVGGTEEQLAGSFKVEEYKVPLMRALITLPAENLVQPGVVQPQLTVGFQNGGPAANMDVVFRHQIQKLGSVNVSDYEDFSFMTGKVIEGVRRSGEQTENQTEEVVTQKAKLSATGAAAVQVTNLNNLTQPQSLNMELEFRDANGEIQTVGRSTTVWPSDYLVGLRAQSWVADDKDIDLQVAVLDLKQRPVVGQSVNLTGYKVETFSHRKRLVGGFYAYENVTETKRLPVQAKCSGVSDSRGLILCSVRVTGTGEIQLMVESADSKGRRSFTSTSVYVRGKDDFWFDAQDTDRIDLIPERRRYEPGQTARLQVRMPFRQATALVTTEREGVIDAKVVRLTGDNPVVELPLKNQYAPNIFVSTFLVRGRVSEAARYQRGQEFLVDLNKPAFKMGVAQLYINWAAHELKVNLTANKEVYQPREEASVKVVVKDSQGQPVKGEFAFAVVDEGLLQLQPNRSWNLLEEMMARRPWSVQTATVQMQVVGKRHYGQKAVAHGGDGGSQITRELFDTLVTWQGRVRLNENGEATVKFKLNDSLTKFRLVAVAQNGLAQFGTGQTSITATQDLIAMPSQAKLARQGDQFVADMTLRNTTKKATTALVKGQVTFFFGKDRQQVVQIGEKKVNLAAEAAVSVLMGQVQVPKGATRAEYLYTVEGAGGQKDNILMAQDIKPLVVARTQMSQLEQLSDKPALVGVETPKGAEPSVGGVRVTLIDSLARGLESVRDYFQNCIFVSLETLISEAVATNDVKLWNVAMKKLEGQLDSVGLVKWYPLSERGSFDLTSYILAISKDANLEVPVTARDKMITALTALSEGRLRREVLKDMGDRELLLRRVSAMAALSRYKLAKAEWLKTITLPPADQLPTVTLIDWMRVVAAVTPANEAVAASLNYNNALRARMTLVGTRFEVAPDHLSLWWLMSSRAGVQARLITMALSNESLLNNWRQDLPRVQAGLMSYMRAGHWDLPVTNAWAAVAIRQFAKVIEAGKVSGLTQIDLGQQHLQVDWSKNANGAVSDLTWPEGGRGEVTVSHRGQGKPWAMIATVAAIPTTKESFVGLQVQKTMKATRQAVPGKWSRGDVVEVTLKIKAQTATSQVALFDPIPSGAKILSSGLAADDPRSTKWVWPEFDEKSYEGYRAIYSYVPTTDFEVVYRFQLNASGTFQLPATRLEALYTPETFAELANRPWTVQ